MVADVGIMGLPNVGKSSILKALTNANPKIAGYPFTTLEPNLGVLVLRKSEIRNPKPQTNPKSEILNEKNNLIIVDVPGVVEEAWEGKGIGPWFMRHLERTNTLIHVLAPEITPLDHYTIKTLGEQLVRDYKIVRKELEKYGKGLADKEEIVVVNKMELVNEKMRAKIDIEFDKKIHKLLVWVSAGMGEVGELVKSLTVI